MSTIVKPKADFLYLEDDTSVRTTTAELCAYDGVIGIRPTCFVNPGHLEEYLQDLHAVDARALKQKNFFVITDGSMDKIVGDKSDTYQEGPRQDSTVEKTCRGTLEVLNRWKDKIGSFFVTILAATPDVFGLEDFNGNLEQGIKECHLNPATINEAACLRKPARAEHYKAIWEYFLSLIKPEA